MYQLGPMLETHPQRDRMRSIGGLPDLITHTMSCAQACTTCADACMGETANIGMLVRCMRLNLDCARICAVTSDMFSRATEPDWRILRAQLQACLTACAVCAEECEKHANKHAHCRMCAEACRACERACQQALQSAPAMTM